MPNLKQKLQSLVTRVRVAFIRMRIQSINNRQREERFKLTLASAMRLNAQEQFDERTELNAARLTKLVARLEELQGQPPLWMGVDLSPEPDSTATLKIAPTPELQPAYAPTAATESELRLAAGQATAGQVQHGDASLDWPLPYDITVGGCTMRRGVPLRTLVARMKVLHAMASQNYPKAANMAVEPTGASAS